MAPGVSRCNIEDRPWLGEAPQGELVYLVEAEPDPAQEGQAAIGLVHNLPLFPQASAATYSPTSSSSKRASTLDFRVAGYGLGASAEWSSGKGSSHRLSEEGGGYGASSRARSRCSAQGRTRHRREQPMSGVAGSGLLLCGRPVRSKRTGARSRSTGPLHPLRSLCRDGGPGRFVFESSPEIAVVDREHLVVPGRVESD